MNPKRQILLAVLERAWAYLHLDGRAEGVEVPEWLRGPQLTLQIGYDMPNPIHDLKIDEQGVSATLSFRQAPFACKVPWGALYAISDVDGHGVMFPEDLPPELEAQVAGEAAKRLESVPAAGSAVIAPREPSAKEPPAAEPPRMKSGKPRPSHLKLV